MQCTSLAQLSTEAFIGLGMPPKEFCEAEDCIRAVVHGLSLLEQHATYSAQNLALNSIEFVPRTRDFPLDEAPGLVVPAWVERNWIGQVEPFDYWHFVPVCNLADIESSRIRGQSRCSFYISNGQMRMKLSYSPLQTTLWTYRLWYTVSPFMVDTLNDTALDAQVTAIPQNFFPYVSALAEMELIPTMMIRAAADGETNKALIAAWQNRQAYLAGKIEIWSDRFKHWAYGNRGTRRGRRRRNVLSSTSGTGFTGGYRG